MPRRINRRQKPAWQKLRKPISPPTRPHTSKKGKKGYSRKEKSRKKELGEND
ncbi:MAG: hypothetical protein ACE5WD_02335 [Candidatus Aminicenantia bacterium]